MGRRSFGGVFLFHAATVVFLAMGTRPAEAVPIGGIDFPAGAVSFVDALVSYSPPGGPFPTAPHRDPLNALGLPNYIGDFNCTGDPTCPFVSLGVGGSIILQFTDNSLTGSGDSKKDLHIFETGPDIEDAFIDISKNGVDWFAIGKILGSTSSIDIDRFGWGPTDFFFFVRVTDDPREGAVTGIQVGADIDAVGAITSGPPPPSTTTTTTTGTTTTTAPTEAPEPATILLLGAALGAWALSNARRRS
jgi:PEP-CTERM motif